MRLPHLLMIGATIGTLAACASPTRDNDIVVTSTRTPDAQPVTAERAADQSVAEAAPPPPGPPPPPPPPPPALMSAPDASSIVVSGSRERARTFGFRLHRASPSAPSPRYVGRDRFTNTPQNPFRVAREEPVSTFSIDVDTASYSFVRASLNNNVLPQPAAVRTEEMVNYFPYDYANPRSVAEPFSTNVAVFPSPWRAGRKLVRIGIKGYAIQRATRPRANLVFLIDTSGSMNAPNRLPLVKQSLAMLIDRLAPGDRVAIVAYAGAAGTVLDPTPAGRRDVILSAIDRLGAGGGTAGAEGIRQAYALAARNFDPQGVNRVILATDGDFNVGITDPQELKGFVERERGKGVFLSVLGYGMGNYNDALMQTLAQNGNGAAAYIDTIHEARKVLVDEATSTLFPIAKDVKIQVEFNPAAVAEYRLIGYETRMLNREDFDNDRVDAGDVGSGQTVTALYEIVPVGGPRVLGDLRYGAPTPTLRSTAAREYGFVKIRYKLPKSTTSRLIATPIDRRAEVGRFADAPRDARFAAGVAGFAELLRGGKYNGDLRYDDIERIVAGARGDDAYGYRAEFLRLVQAAKSAGAMAELR